MNHSFPNQNRCLSRRAVLAGAAVGSLGLAMPAALRAQNALESVALRDNIYLVTGAGANTVVAVGPDSVLVIDGGLQKNSATMLQKIDRLAAGKPVSTLFNSNWRPEHRGLNRELGSAGAEIIAHENTRLWQNNDFTVDWEGRHHRPMSKQVQANKTFYKTGSLQLGHENITYGRIAECHTDGDIYIHFQESNILFAGDMLAVSTYPILDYVTGGWIGGAQVCTASLRAMADSDTLVIPALGAPQQALTLDLQQQMLDHAYEKVADAYRTGRSLAQFRAASPMAQYNTAYGDPDLFVELLYRGTWYHVPGRAIPGII